MHDHFALGGAVQTDHLSRVPDWVAAVLRFEGQIAGIVERYRFMSGTVTVGRGLNYANDVSGVFNAEQRFVAGPNALDKMLHAQDVIGAATASLVRHRNLLPRRPSAQHVWWEGAGQRETLPSLPCAASPTRSPTRP